MIARTIVAKIQIKKYKVTVWFIKVVVFIGFGAAACSIMLVSGIFTSLFL